jgi:hypothetical protein
MQITAVASQYQTIHLASYQSYQSQLIQYHPNQSTIDEAGETLTKKQKVKHAASRKKSVPSEKPNMRFQMQMRRVREGTPKRYRANIHWNISWFELKSRVTSDSDSPVLSGGLRPVLEKNEIQLQNFVQINGPQWICIGSHNGSA